MSKYIDDGRAIDWGMTSGDYAKFRPGPPPMSCLPACAYWE